MAPPLYVDDGESRVLNLATKKIPLNDGTPLCELCPVIGCIQLFPRSNLVGKGKLAAIHYTFVV